MKWRISVCMEAVEENLRMLSDIGIDAIEIPGSLQVNPFKVSREDLREIKELSEAYGIDIVASNVIYPPDLSHASNSESLRKKSVDYTYRLAKAASEIECPVLVWGSGRVRSIPPGVPLEEGRKRNLLVLREAAKAGEEFNVRFGIEPLPKNETNFVNTIEEALKLVEEVNSDFLKVTVDVRHMIREEFDAVESLRIAGGNIVHVHLADNNSRVPGRGIIDFRKLFECFNEIGYGGAMSIEAMLGDDPRGELKFALEVLRKSVSSL